MRLTFNDAEYHDALEKTEQDWLLHLRHLGNNGVENLVQRLEFMAVSLGVEVIVLITLLPLLQVCLDL